MEELKPCPFCGSDNVEMNNFIYDDAYVVLCRDCDCQTAGYYDKEVAAITWNTRSGEEPEAAEQPDFLFIKESE